MAKTSTVLLTGGTGFLGQHLVAKLVAHNFKVILLCRRGISSQALRSFGGAVIPFRYDGGNLSQCFAAHNVDFVIHTATCYGREQDTYGDVVAANLMLPLQLIDLSIANHVKVFINTDTFFTSNLGLDSKRGSYIKTKKLFLELAKDAMRGSGICLVNMIIQQMYGPGDSDNKFVSLMLKTLLSNAPSIDLTPGEQKRDFVFVEDVAASFVQVLKHRRVLSDYEEFEIGTGTSISIKRAVRMMKKITRSTTKLNWGSQPYRVNEILNSRANVRKNKKIHWHAKVDLNRGLSMILT